MAAAAELTIHRLHLGPAPPPVAARLALQLEDALRTSSKPAALLHRHVLVRRLRLRMPAAASAPSISRQLAQAWQRIAGLATPLDSAVDADEAVWAPSEAAARAALVLRWVRGEAPTAWFWQRIALPAADASAAWPQRALRLMLVPLVADGPRGAMVVPGSGAAALRPVLQALAGAGMLPRLAAALTAAEARQLLAVIEAEALSAAAWLPPGAGQAAAPPVAGRPAAASVSAGVLAQAWQVLQARLAWPADGPVPRPALLPSLAKLRAGSLPDEAVPRPAVPVLQRDLDAATAAVGPSSPQAVPVDAADIIPSAIAPLDTLDTAWAGLWLLLPVLLRCGLGEDDAPLAAFAQALQAAPDALHIPADDPVRGSIAALDLPPADAPGPWLRRARLAALRDARLPLRRIARRHGTVHLSDVRLDLVFPLRAADVRIRRAGFDLDPGFVPWLGRIVHIHYA